MSARERLADLLSSGALTRARADLEAERKRANSAVNLAVDRTAHATREEAAAEEARRAAAREADAIHVVYYVRTGDRTIKIGTTGHLEERMRAFRVANPDNLLAAERGDRELEQQRHRQFHAWRYHRRREDFGDALELLEHIAAVRGEHGDPWILGGAR